MTPNNNFFVNKQVVENILIPGKYNSKDWLEKNEFLSLRQQRNNYLNNSKFLIIIFETVNNFLEQTLY